MNALKILTNGRAGLAEMAVNVEALRSFTYRIAWMVDEGRSEIQKKIIAGQLSKEYS